MRSAERVLAGFAMIAGASAAQGQDLSGPLLARNATPAAVVTKREKSVHAARRAKPMMKDNRIVVPTSARLPVVQDHTITSAKVTVPDDPMSFGMKWNGSNDSAGQTRIENLNGGAVGTGAEVGMKLHF